MNMSMTGVRAEVDFGDISVLINFQQKCQLFQKQHNK